ncbi:unnamed protein product, partial [Rotaria sp. Silwood2]
IHDLQVHLARCKEEVIQSITNIETESVTKIMFQHQIRKHLERELIEENQSLRNELLDQQVYEECKSTISELYLKYTKQTEDLTSRFE